MNVCAKCEARFDKWSDYYKHLTTVKCAKIIRLINISGRTKEQIVSAVEEELCAHISTPEDTTLHMRYLALKGPHK